MPSPRLAAVLTSFLAAACVTPHRPDGQPKWSIQESQVTTSLRGICVVDAATAWASGSDGTVLRTTDSGKTWEQLTVDGADTLDFRDVHAADAEIAWLLTAGSPARVYATRDGGTSWTIEHDDPRPEAFFDSIAFWNHANGLVFGDPLDGTFTVLRRIDDAWVQAAADALPKPAEGEAGFAASGTCIALHGHDNAWIATGGRQSRVLRSNDGGQTWSASTTPMRNGAASTGAFSISFADARHGMIVGGDYEDPLSTVDNAAVTSDGGLTWQRPRVPPHGYRSAVAFLPHAAGRAWVAVGSHGADYSLDGGHSWMAIEDVAYNAIAFAPAGRIGWAVGSDGRIARVSW